MRTARKPPEELELPAQVHITPSKINPWRGSKSPGARFTHRQLRAMEELSIDPAKVDELNGFVRCRSTISRAEYWWPETESTPVYVFDCPIIAMRPNGFRLVIAPSGDRKIVHESGRLKRGR